MLHAFYDCTFSEIYAKCAFHVQYILCAQNARLSTLAWVSFILHKMLCLARGVPMGHCCSMGPWSHSSWHKLQKETSVGDCRILKVCLRPIILKHSNEGHDTKGPAGHCCLQQLDVLLWLPTVQYTHL